MDTKAVEALSLPHAGRAVRMKILVVGGTGGFGLPICSMLMADGHEVVAIGRDRGRGHAACEAVQGLTFRSIDRCDLSVSMLQMVDAEMLVDASGPFQHMQPSLAETAMEAGIHYVDIADDRMFVRRVVALNDDARRRGTCLITGASSVPGISGAVASRLSSQMDRVDRIDVSISANGSAVFGRSVLSSMLSGAGRDIVHSDGMDGSGMTASRTITISAGGRSLTREVLACDVPDHDGYGELVPGRPVVRFRAGSEHLIHNHAISMVASMVRRRMLSDARSLQGVAHSIRSVPWPRSSGMSGMKVEMRGWSGDEPVLLEWSLVAAEGYGAAIPALVVPEVVRQIVAGQVAPGAHTAAGIIDPHLCLSRLPSHLVGTSTHRTSPSPLYSRIMGRSFGDLAPRVREMHDDPWVMSASGHATVVRSTSLTARIICRIFGFPETSNDVPVKVEFERMGEDERWTRRFGRRSFSSVLRAKGSRLVETFGPFSFMFELKEHQGAIHMIPRGWTLFGINMPDRLAPSGVATESDDDGLFVFDVPIRLPFLGPIVRYRGWLQPEKVAGKT